VVHRDAQRLEGSGGGIALVPALRPHGAAYDLGQLSSGFDALQLARLDDGARHAAALSLLAVAPQDVGDLGLVGLIDEIGSRGPALVHSHVERGGGAEGKAALVLIELHRRHAEVERHAVDFVDALGRQQFGHVAEASFDQAQPRRVALSHCLAGGDRVGIAVDRDDLALGAIEHGAGVATGAERAVEVAAAVRRAQRVHDLAGQHGNVTGAHASPVPRPRTKAAIFSRSVSRRCCQRPGFHIWNLSPLPTSITPSPTSSTLANSAGKVKRPSGSIAMVRALADRWPAGSNASSSSATLSAPLGPSASRRRRSSMASKRARLLPFTTPSRLGEA